MNTIRSDLDCKHNPYRVVNQKAHIVKTPTDVRTMSPNDCLNEP